MNFTAEIWAYWRKGMSSVPAHNNLGTHIESEMGNGLLHIISYTPGTGPHASFEAIQIPEGNYFLMGDNRDQSMDSRMYGTIPRHMILGKVIYPRRPILEGGARRSPGPRTKKEDGYPPGLGMESLFYLCLYQGLIEFSGNFPIYGEYSIDSLFPPACSEIIAFRLRSNNLTTSTG